MQTVIQERWGKRYQDDISDLGFSGRAAYAMGLDEPHYPVPATIGRTFITEWAVGTYAADMNHSQPHARLWYLNED